jgi:hypothetical protein
MKVLLTLIASALLLMSNVAVAQNRSARRQKTDQDIGERVGEIVRDVMAQGMRGHGMRAMA